VVSYPIIKSKFQLLPHCLASSAGSPSYSSYQLSDSSYNKPGFYHLRTSAWKAVPKCFFASFSLSLDVTNSRKTFLATLDKIGSCFPFHFLWLFLLSKDNRYKCVTIDDQTRCPQAIYTAGLPSEVFSLEDPVKKPGGDQSRNKGSREGGSDFFTGTCRLFSLSQLPTELPPWSHLPFSHGFSIKNGNCLSPFDNKIP
jgi:hypothetical protein